MSNRELRLIVTQACNYNCVFCHKEGLQTKQRDAFNAEDFKFLFEVGKKNFGLNTTTLSGGEPLVRKDIVGIAKSLNESGAEIVITTNGFLLGERIEVGNYLKRLNLSLHVLDKLEYEKIVQKKDTYEKVLVNLFAFREKYPNVEIRLNATLVKGINTSDEKINSYIDLAEKLSASIKFLELYPNTLPGFYSLEKFGEKLKQLGFKLMEKDNRKTLFEKKNVKIILGRIFCAFAEQTKDPYNECKKYNDLFITPEGKIKPCRSILREIDIYDEVKNQDAESLKNKIILGLSLLGEDCKCVTCQNYGGKNE